MAEDRIFFYMISSGSCFTQSRVPTNGVPRLFDPADIYIYRSSGKLLVSRDTGVTWINIIPSGMGSVSVIAQTVGSNFNSVTYVIGRGSSGYVARYQDAPEITTWSSGSTPPSGLVPSDAAADSGGDVGILVGNSHAGTESRIVGSFTGSPYQLVDSDAGIPQITPDIAQITDIEICE